VGLPALTKAVEVCPKSLHPPVVLCGVISLITVIECTGEGSLLPLDLLVKLGEDRPEIGEVRRIGHSKLQSRYSL
jgi:hypothetical protein